VGVAPVKASSVSPMLLTVLGIFQPMMKELKETDYQRERPYVLDDSAAREVFGLEPTPWNEIIGGVVAHYRGVANYA
jgi:hypothetical protein